MRHVIVHHHIFKNAGTTLDSALRKSLGPAFVDVDTMPMMQPITVSSMRHFLLSRPNVRGITSHGFHTRSFYELEGSEGDGDFSLFHAVLLRHPIDRIVSMYDFYRSGGGDHDRARDKARGLSLVEWIDYMIDCEPHLVNDAQVNILARHGTYFRPPSELELKIATDRLPSFWLVGTTERFDDACIAAEYFGMPTFASLDLACAPRNVSFPRTGGSVSRIHQLSEILGQRCYDALYRLNRLDLELWLRAEAELDRRLSLIQNIELRAAAFQRRKSMPGLGLQARTMIGEVSPQTGARNDTPKVANSGR